MGDYFPQSIIGSSSFGGIETTGDERFDNPDYFLYDQSVFDMPAYDFFNIYKIQTIFYPFEGLSLDFGYTKNENKFASGIDDNINHFFSEIRFESKDKKISTRLNYTYSKLFDIPGYINTNILKYESHKNIFYEISYKISQTSRLYLNYGIFAGMDEDYINPFFVVPWSLPVLDTRNIVRITYSKKI